MTFLTNEERDTVLAALRYWQAAITLPDAVSVDDFHQLMLIATNCREHTALTSDQIDDLCEKINCRTEK